MKNRNYIKRATEAANRPWRIIYTDITFKGRHTSASYYLHDKQFYTADSLIEAKERSILEMFFNTLFKAHSLSFGNISTEQLKAMKQAYEQTK